MQCRLVIIGFLMVCMLPVMHAQSKIEGPTEVCGDCHDFTVGNSSGTNLTWVITSISGPSWQVQGSPLTICFDSTMAYGAYTISTYTPNGQSLTHTVYYYPPNPIAVFQQGGAFCPIPGGACPQVCAGTELRYGMEYPGQIAVAIEVIGGTLIHQEEYAFEIRWDQPGQGSVTIRPDHDCLLEVTLCVQILPTPIARIGQGGNLLTGIVNVCAGGTLSLEDISQPAGQPFWSVSDGQTSDLLSPVFRFQTPGDYTVTLIEHGGCICSDTTMLVVTVDANRAPDIDCIGTVCPGERVTYRTTPGCNYQWMVSPEGMVVAGGSPTDDSITILWQSGPEGTITLEAPACAGICAEPSTFSIPVMDGSAAIRGPVSVCAGTEVIYALIPYNGTSYTWTVSPGATILEGQGSNQIRVLWPNSPAITTGWVEVDYQHCTLGCTGQANLDIYITFPFHVRGPLMGCPDDNLVFQALRGSLPIPCSWEVRDSSGVLVLSQGSPTAAFNFLAIHGSGIFTIIAHQNDPAQSCNPSYRWTVRVVDLPPPPDGIDGPTLICPGDAYMYTALTSYPGYLQEWTITNAGTQSTRNQLQTIVTWTNGGAPWQLALRHRQTSFPNCISDPIFLYPSEVTMLAIQGPTQVCPGEWVTYEIGGNNIGPTITWQTVPAQAGVVRPGANNGSVEVRWLEPGIATLEASGCGVSQSLSVSVSTPPATAITAPAGVCQGAVAQVQADPGLARYGWHDTAGNLISDQPAVGLGPGTWILGVEDAFGCTDTTSFTLNAWPAPVISLSSPDPHGFCSANGDSGPILYTITDPGGYSYVWFLDNVQLPGVNGAIFQTVQTGTYHVVVTDANGCTSASNPLTVFEHCSGGGGVIIGNGNVNGTPCPELGYVLNPGTFCNERQYTGFSSGGPLLNEFWRIYDLTLSPFPVFNQTTVAYTYPRAGYYTVYFSASINGTSCDLAFIDTIPVSADFQAETVCAGAAMLFTDKTTYLPAHGIVDWAWDFGDPGSGASNTSSLQHPSHVFSQAGQFDVTLIVTSSLGCTSRMIRQVEVRPPANLQIQASTQACVATSLDFEALSDREMVSLLWNFDDPGSGSFNLSALRNATHSFNTPGSYLVTLQGVDIYGCTATEQHNIQIAPNTLTGQIQYLSPICEGDSTSLHFDGGGVTLSWSHGPTVNDPFVKDAGIYALEVQDAFGCRYAPPPALVSVTPAPFGLIRALDLNEQGVITAIHYQYYQACQGLPVRLGLELAGNYSVVWSSGETTSTLLFSEDRGNALSVGTHIFTVTLTDPLTGCVTTIGPMTVDVRPLPAKPQIAFLTPPPHCAFSGEQIQVVAPVGGITYHWSSGQTGTQIEAIGQGSYTVRAINIHGCQRESDPLQVQEAPSTLLAPDGCLRACRPDTLCIDTPPWLQSWQWHLDGQPVPAPPGTQSVLSIDQSGRYSLVLTHQNGCQSESDGVYMTLYDGISQFNGQVWFDVNDNGILDGPDTLVSGIKVLLKGPDGTIWSSTSQGSQGYGFEDIAGLGAFRIGVDTTSLPPGWTLVWPDSIHDVAQCNEEILVNFLLRFQCQTVESDLSIQVCPGKTILYAGDTLTAGMSETYTLQTLQGCDSLVNVSVSDFPDFTYMIAADTSCPNLATGQIRVDPDPGYTLSASLNGEPWQQILFWENLAPGPYTLRIRDNNDCEQQISLVVPSWTEPQFSLNGGILECESPGVPVTIQWQSGQERITGWHWQDGSTDSLFLATQTGQVTLTADWHCGSVVRSVGITPGNDAQRPASFFFIPNVFTPDKNGINDVFRPLPAQGITVEDYRFEVFDRWGNLMFRTEDLQQGWDGIMRDELPGQQVFVWWVKASVLFCRDRVDLLLKGDVTLLKLGD